MNTQKLVNEKIAKVALKNQKLFLKNQKVDLAISDDIKKMISQGNKLLSELKSLDPKLKSADKELISKVKSAVKEANKIASDDAKKRKEAAKLEPKIGTVLDKAEKAANALGVNATEITGFLELENIYADLEDASKSDFMWSDLSPLVRDF